MSSLKVSNTFTVWAGWLHLFWWSTILLPGQHASRRQTSRTHFCHGLSILQSRQEPVETVLWYASGGTLLKQRSPARCWCQVNLFCCHIDTIHRIKARATRSEYLCTILTMLLCQRKTFLGFHNHHRSTAAWGSRRRSWHTLRVIDCLVYVGMTLQLHQMSWYHTPDYPSTIEKILFLESEPLFGLHLYSQDSKLFPTHPHIHSIIHSLLWNQNAHRMGSWDCPPNPCLLCWIECMSVSDSSKPMPCVHLQCCWVCLWQNLTQILMQMNLAW